MSNVIINVKMDGTNLAACTQGDVLDVGLIPVSAEEGNGLEKKADGLFVGASGAGGSGKIVLYNMISMFENIADDNQIFSVLAMFDLDSVLSTMYLFLSSGITTLPAGTKFANNINASGMFASCQALTSLPAGFVMPKCANMVYLFNNCTNLVSVNEDFSAASATNINGIFSNCPKLEHAYLHGAKVSFGVQGTKMGADALNALFTSLGQADTGATVTITNTPGAATCDRTIAEAKGWTVVG